MRDKFLLELAFVLDLSALDIDVDANFIELGGHSLTAIALKSACKSQGIFLSVESILGAATISDLLKSVDTPSWGSEHSTAASSPDNASWKRDENSSIPKITELPEILSESLLQDAKPVTTLLFPPAVISESAQMTEMQLMLIHGSQKQPGTNIINYYETYRPEDIPLMKRAWKAVIDSEPIFRTTFELQEGNGILVEQGVASFSWTEVLVRSQEEYEKEVDDEHLQSQVETSFKVVTLPNGPKGLGKSTVIWRVHHALIDGYSSTILLGKVRKLAAGLPIHPGPSFTRVARALQAFQETSRIAGETFWKKQQELYPSTVGELLLAPPLSQVCGKANATESIVFEVPVDLLSLSAKNSGVTLATLYYAAWILTLSKYVDDDSVVFGAVLSGRNLPIPGVEETIGPLMNTLPFHFTLDRNSTVIEYLRVVFRQLIELASFQWTFPEHGYRRYFSSALGLQFETPIVRENGIAPHEQPYNRMVSDVPLNILVEANGCIRLNYHSNIYNRTDIESLGEIFRNAILSLQHSHRTVGMCIGGLLSNQSLQELRRFGNCNSGLTTTASIDDDLVTLFERAVAKNPENPAVEKGDKSLTFAELNASANVIAKNITTIVGPADIVCVHADRSINWIIAIYGILKAEAIYCPFDEALPADLRDSNFQSSGSKLFLSPSITQKANRPRSCTNCLAVEELLVDAQPMDQEDYFPRRTMAKPAASAYLCFTSGSTGKPKGVLCAHEGLVAFQRDPEVRLFAQPGVRVAQVMSPAFDGSVHEIFSTLSYGATLVLQHSFNPFAHVKLVDSALLTPSIAKMLDPVDFPKLKNLYLVGEPVPQHVNDTWSSTKVVYNMYGPTEATCGATIKRLLPNQPVNVGGPNPSTRIYILGCQQELVPQGVIGEICLAGVQVSRGYVGRPDETARHFLPDPICRHLGEYIYRTGDRGYWNRQGEVVCLGRNDRQIKLRGFRLDLNDLEIRILKACSTATAVAVVQQESYLVAMVQPSYLDISDLRSRISRVLAVHAVPKHIVAVDRFPMTGAGKVDYKAIAATRMQSSFIQKRALSKPSEAKLAAAWREILSLDPEITLDGNSDFIDLGGTSITQLLLASRLAKAFGRQIPFRLIVQSQSLGEMARSIEFLENQGLLQNEESSEVTLWDHELSPIEQEWFHKYELDSGSSAFSVSFACALDEKIIDRPKLVSAWNCILARHRILRGRFINDRSGYAKRVYADFPPQVQRVRSLDVWKEINRSFQLAKSHPVRVVISRDRMVVTISHIICDLTTLQVLLREVALVYNGVHLPPNRISYADAGLWNKIATICDLEFWGKYMEDAPKNHSSIHKLDNRASYSGCSQVCKISRTTYHHMLSYTKEHKVTLHQVALAAVALALQYDSESHDIVLGAPYFNRKTEDDLEIVGLFLEPFPIRIRYPTPLVTHHNASIIKEAHQSNSFIRSVQMSSQAALSHAVPWNQLLRHLDITPQFPEHPLTDTMVTFHDCNTTKLPLQGMEPLYTWTEGAKFKLLAEFSAVDKDTLLLRLEHDKTCFVENGVDQVERLIVYALDGLVAGLEYGQIKEYMMKALVKGLREEERMETGQFFGARLNTL